MPPITGKISASSRRTHNKSRSGCGNCKRRRVKCDERRPVCSNCANHGIECTFANAESESTNASSSGAGRCRFRHYQYLPGGTRRTVKTSDIEDEEAALQPNSIGTQCNLSTSTIPGTLSLADLELFHHFIISTSCTVSDDPDGHDFWQNHLIQWGMTDFPSILHLVMALSALHMGYERLQRRDEFVRRADEHFTFGVRSVTAIISQLDADNCQKVYIVAVLICFVYFGKGPCPGEYLIFSDRGPGEWLVLMHGVKLILESHREEVFSGILEPKNGPPVARISESLCRELQEHTSHIQAVRRLIESEDLDDDDRAMYMLTLDNLLETLREVYEKRSAQLPPVGLMQVLVGWLYRLPPRMVNLLEQKKPLALIVLAYWAMMLKYMRSVWFMEGWAEHVVSGICMFLREDYQRWIEWPLHQVQSQ